MLTDNITSKTSCQSPIGQSSPADSFACLAPSNVVCHIRKKYLGSGKSHYDGSLCLNCLWGGLSPLLVPNSYQSAENKQKLEHRKKRFMVRAFRGVSIGISKGYRFRWFVLTESDDAISAGISFGREFHKFVTWLRYICPDFQYIVVEHRQGNKKRRNWHILSYGSDRLPVLKIRSYWLSHYLSTVTGMAEVKDIGKSIYYLADYLSSADSFVRSFSSQGWVFRGWLGASKAYKRSYSDYPSASELATLALMSPTARSFELDYLLNTGYLSTRFEAVKLDSTPAPLAKLYSFRLSKQSNSESLKTWKGLLSENKGGVLYVKA